MEYVDLIKQHLGEGSVKKKEMDLGECFGNLVSMENFLKSMKKKKEKYGNVFSEMTQDKNEGFEHFTECFSLEDGLIVRRQTTIAPNGDVVFMEVFSCNGNGGDCSIDEYDVNAYDKKRKFKHYEAELRYSNKEPFIKSNVKQSFFTDSCEFLERAVRKADEAESQVEKSGGASYFIEGDYKSL